MCRRGVRKGQERSTARAIGYNANQDQQRTAKAAHANFHMRANSTGPGPWDAKPARGRHTGPDTKLPHVRESLHAGSVVHAGWS